MKFSKWLICLLMVFSMIFVGCSDKSDKNNNYGCLDAEGNFHPDGNCPEPEIFE